MPSEDSKKRKACQNCTRAKAKCSPSEHGSDVCYRCHRLKKECIFEETARKKGAKTRSRVKQLERRVDTLIDLLASNGQSTNGAPIVAGQTATQEDSNTDRAASPAETVICAMTETYITPVETPSSRAPRTEVIEPYDPIQAGLIHTNCAAMLLDTFRDSFVTSFPFVVVPDSIDVNTLRRQKPFLFHAIMAVTAYSTPSIQCTLVEELKQQIASRVIMRSHKSLEILQGLLVFAAWYHFFYKEQEQLMSITVQLCVAMILDLGLTKNPRDKVRELVLTEDQCGLIFKSERSAAEKRAFLGTYYLTATFAQAWRKRNTMAHTKYMAQCCRTFAEHPEQPTDTLIAPLIQMSEFMCRVSDYFSYDDVDNSEIHGDAMLETSTSNFRSEFERLQAGIPERWKHNTTIKLKCSLIEAWIHEGSLHSVLWNSQSANNPCPISPNRLRMLHRTMKAMKSYFNTVLAVPDNCLHYLALPSWTGWFYVNMVACKLVFLQDNERAGQASFDDISSGPNALLPKLFGSTPPGDVQNPASASGITTCTTWDPRSIAEEAEVQQLFEKMILKLKFTYPASEDFTTCNKGERDPLFSAVFLQYALLNGFTKRMKEYLSKETTNSSNNPSAPTTNSTPFTQTDMEGQPQWNFQSPAPQPATPGEEYLRRRMREHPTPFLASLNFEQLDFEGVDIPPANPAPQPQTSYDDWVWNMMMEDFTMPPL